MICQNCGHALPPSVRFCPKCGMSVTPPSYQPPPDRIQTSWAPQTTPGTPKRKSRVGKVLLILFSIFLVVVAGAGVAAYFGYRYVEKTLRNSEAYRVAESTLRESKEVSERMGEIRSTGFPIGAFDEKAGGTGNAAFYMSVEGTKTSGQYFVTMERENSAWRVSRGVVKLPDGEVINIVDPAEETGGSHQPGGTHAGHPNQGTSKQNANLNSNAGRVSGGVLDAKAISKPEPTYPPIAKAARASGKVTVEVTVDETGRVISARAASGHPLLQSAAVDAARKARFSPTMLKGKPVKVAGVLTYDFALK